MKKIARRDRRNCLILALLCVLAYVPAMLALASGAWHFVDDGLTLFNIWHIIGNRGFGEGIVALWNPYIFCGLPFFANNQSAILYPPNIIYLFFPMGISLLVDAIGHNIFLACGAYVLGRAWRLSRTASFVMALAFALAGGVSAHIYNGHMTWHAVRAYLPWELALLTLYLRRGQKRWAVGLAICFALQVAAGYPPLVLVSAALCFGLLLTWMGHHRALPALGMPRGWPGALTMFLVLTCLLSALFVLPLAEMSRHSVHGDELNYRQATALSGSWTTLARLVAPGVFGNNNDLQWSKIRRPHEEVGYIGLFPLLLALTAPWLARGSTKHKPIWLLWCLLPFAVLMAMGRHLPLYGWVFEIFPPLRQTRVPARWMEIFYYGAALLSGFGFDYLVRRRTGGRRTEQFFELVFWVLCVLFLLLMVAAVMTPPTSEFWLRTVQTGMPKEVRFSPSIAAVMQRVAWGETLIVAAVAGVTIYVWRRTCSASTPRQLQSARLMLVILITLDLLGLFWRSAKIASPHDLRRYVTMPTQLTQLYASKERWDTQVVYALMNHPAAHGVHAFTGYDALGAKLYFQFVAQLEKRFVWGAMYEPTRRTPLLRVSGVTHTITSPKARVPLSSREFPAYKPRLVTSHGEFNLWQWPAPWPRAYLTRQVHQTPERQQLKQLETIAAQTNKPNDAPPVIVSPGTFAAISNLPLSKDEGVVNWQPSFDRVTFQTRADHHSVLVFADSFYPGWKAFVNGKPTPVERANVLFRGLAVPPGESRVEMIYEPQSYRLGMFLTLCALGTLGFLGTTFLTARSSPAKWRRLSLSTTSPCEL